MFCRLKDFRRVATRHDRNAANFLAAAMFKARRATGWEALANVSPAPCDDARSP
jgi:hypothetical protein